MANLTLSIDDELLRRARIRALEKGTSVNAVVRSYLGEFAGADRVRDARDDLVAQALGSAAASGPGGRRATRGELYEDRLRPEARPK